MNKQQTPPTAIATKIKIDNPPLEAAYVIKTILSTKNE
jgi:hypothetical protein